MIAYQKELDPMQVMTPSLRKTRFVCVSDTHNASPADGAFKLPAGDVLVHAGDLTNQGSLSELRKTLDWIEQADFEAKIVVAGNHDVTLDPAFYAEHGHLFHNQHPQDPDACRKLILERHSIAYLHHEATEVKLQKEGGPKTTFKIFGSPYSPAHGFWAFGYKPAAASELWDQIPLDSDIVLTHTPPNGHCDKGSARGCEALRLCLSRVRPRLAICGHVHEGRGIERVSWDAAYSNSEGNSRWVDPGHGNKKQSLIDLTRKAGSSLKNDGSRSHLESTPSCSDARARCLNDPDAQLTDVSSAACISDSWDRSEDNDIGYSAGWIGRRETCVINAAIMASSYLRKSRGKTFNKPIVVDLELPAWDEGVSMDTWRVAV